MKIARSFMFFASLYAVRNSGPNHATGYQEMSLLAPSPFALKGRGG
jgi:hypothetical protein